MKSAPQELTEAMKTPPTNPWPNAFRKALGNSSSAYGTMNLAGPSANIPIDGLRPQFKLRNAAQVKRLMELVANDPSDANLNAAQKLSGPWFRAKLRADLIGHAYKADHAPRGTPPRKRWKSSADRKAGRAAARAEALVNHIALKDTPRPAKYLHSTERRRVAGRGA